MSVTTYTKAGTKATTPAKLKKSIFGLEVTDHQLLKDAYLAYLANGRVNLAKTKTRGEVRGGGQKPWRQKGTGRARVGSSRNPIWEGGGVAFGPTGRENYGRKLSTTAKRLALRQALSLANKENRIKVIEDVYIKDGKTKSAQKLIEKIDVRGTALIVVDSKEGQLKKATANLKSTKLVAANYLNVFDVLNSDTIVISSKALEAVQQWLGGKHE